MSANTYLQITELDFNEIRNNLKTFLSSQTALKDYNFEGSSMAVLLDLLAYNTHYNAYYANMIGNEMFLDTAQQRDSVVSFAKTLGYTPTSAIGARANLRLTFGGVSNTTPQFTIAKNSRFTTTIDDITYTFITPQAYTVINSSNSFVRDIEIKEGTPVTHRFTVDTSQSQRFIIPNTNVDTSSIVVNIQTSSSDATKEEFTRATNIRQVFQTSPIYFLEEASDGKYELVFGQGALGKKLVTGNIIIVDYLVCNDEITNGANTFSAEAVTTTAAYTSININVTKNAYGGRKQETIESIKFNAPRNYQTQNRAVVAEDYQRIILSENSDLQSVVAFGGELAEPQVFGKVFIAIKPFGEQFLTLTRKQQIKESIVERAPLSIDPVIIDAKYTYIVPSITTYYDKNKTTVSPGQIEQAIRSAVATFSTNNLERFGNRLRYSKFARALDNVTTGEILNNDISLKLEYRFVPNTQRKEKVTIEFNNELRPSTLNSSQFIFRGFGCFLDDDGNGRIRIYRFSTDRQKIYVTENTGTISYLTGKIEIDNFEPTAYSGIEMNVTSTPVKLDVIPTREQILIINSDETLVTVIGETI
jgi:hypothetical protein